MTIRAAGLLLTTDKDRKALFLQRSPDSDHPGEWCIPGGHVEEGENVLEAAEREAREEIGTTLYNQPGLWTRRIVDGVDFTTFLARVDDPLIPNLNEEHTAYKWAPINDPPEPLHPGVRIVLRRFGMDELDVAEAIRDGELASPQKYGGFWLFNIRITGTGLCYRENRKEYAWRDSSIYLNERFLRRCNGLAVVWNHPPEKPAIDGAEWEERAIGTTFLPYIRDQEVWAIVKIYDVAAASIMRNEVMSTSPAVVFKSSSGNLTMPLEDGESFLIEGKPSLLDHICVCQNGIWDKGGPPTGIQPSDEGVIGVAEEDKDKAVADSKRHDDDMTSAMMDAIKRMDAVKERMDARLDAMDRKDRHDAARKDKFAKRMDGETYMDWKKRHDADEKAMCDAMRKDGEDEKDCMDSASKARKDAEEDEKRQDKDFEKWAKEEEKEPAHKDKKDAKKDATETEGDIDKEQEKETEKEGDHAKMAGIKDSRHDSALARENAELKDRLAKLERSVRTITHEVTAADRDMLARAQARADSVMAMFGDRAPPPAPGELPLDYRRKMMKRLQRHSPRYKESRFDSYDQAAIDAAEDVVYADAVQAAHMTPDAQPGILVPFEERDRAGRVITKYHGDILGFMGPFMTDGQSGRINRNPKGM